VKTISFPIAKTSGNRADIGALWRGRDDAVR